MNEFKHCKKKENKILSQFSAPSSLMNFELLESILKAQHMTEKRFETDGVF